MSQLLPCPCCNRHVRITDAGCPFCACALPTDSALGKHGKATQPTGVGVRMSRAAMIAAGAALMGAASGCSDAIPAYGGPPFPRDASSDSRSRDSGDAPDADAARADSGDSDSNTTMDAASDGAPNDRGVQALYGAPVQPDR